MSHFAVLPLGTLRWLHVSRHNTHTRFHLAAEISRFQYAFGGAYARPPFPPFLPLVLNWDVVLRATAADPPADFPPSGRERDLTGYLASGIERRAIAPGRDLLGRVNGRLPVVGSPDWVGGQLP
jgi:hypothetical protein